MDERQLQDADNRAACKVLNMVRNITKKLCICSAILALALLVLRWLFGGFDILEAVPVLYWIAIFAVLCVALSSGGQLLVLTLVLKKLED